LLIVFFVSFINVGVTCGPGFSFQVLAFPARNPHARCGLFTAIPNAGPHTIAKRSLHIVTILSGIFLKLIRNDVVVANLLLASTFRL
jgi:hypothetical protein